MRRNPRQLPALRAEVAAAAALATPARYPAFFFVLEKAVKSAGNAVVPTFPSHCPHGLQHLRHKRSTFAFVGKSEYTLGFANRIAHKGTHGETGGFTFVQSCRAFDRPSSGKRTAGGSGCTPTACVRFLRHRSPAGLRNILFGLPMLYFSRSAHGDFCVCEVKAVPRPCGQYAGHLSAWRPGTCPAGPPAGCTAA